MLMTKKITQKRLENIALYYLERYSSSSENLRTVLRRRLRKEELKGAEVPQEAQEWVDKVVLRMQELSYINDEQYKEGLVRRLKEQGKSARQIRLKLHEKGVDGEFASTSEDEYEQALIFLRKKKLGFYRGETREEYKQKDLQKLALAGFSYSTAQQVLALDSAEEI